MNSLTHVVFSPDENRYFEIIGRTDRRCRDYQLNLVITSYGRRGWSPAHQIAIL